MATADIVDVELRARTDSYLRNIKNAETQFVAGLDRIENEAAQAGASLDIVGNKGSQAFQRAASQAPRAAAAISGARLQTANLAAQINDIGVQLAGGTSPFLIAVQQGSQINQVIGQAGAAGAVRALAGAFTSLVNPVSLATFAVIGLSGAAIQYFTSVLSQGEESNRTIEKQAQLIAQVAERWGDAVPALKEYADELRRANDISQLSEATQTAINAQFEEARAILPDVRSEIGAVVQELIRAGAAQSEIDAVRNAFNEFDRAAQDLNTAMQDGKDTTEEFERFSSALAAVLGNDSVTASESLSKAIYRLRDAYNAAAQEASALAQQQAAIAGGPQGGTGGTRRYSRGTNNRPDAYEVRLPDSVSVTPDRRVDPYFADAPRGRGGGRSRAASEAQREAEAVAELIARLDEEIALIGASDEQRAVANNLRRVGASVTEEQRERVAELTRELYRQTEAERAAAEAARELSSIGRDALGGFIQDIRDGVSAADALENALNRVLDRLLDISLDALFDVGGGGGGFLGRLFGGFRAAGGPVQSGRAYVVGERGPELFAPGQSGRIIPRIPQVAGTANSSQTISMPIVINAQGADAAGLARVERQIESLKRSIPTRIDARADTRQSRGTRPAT